MSISLSGLSRAEKIQLAHAIEERARRKSNEYTVVGLVSPVTKQCTKVLQYNGMHWAETDKEPTVYLAEKLEPVLTSNKRFIVVLGGRGSSKSLGVGDICLIEAKDFDAKTYCLREFQSSIKNSVHSLLKDEIARLEMDGFEVMDKSIRRGEEDIFLFAGIARNVSSIKSAHGFKRFFVEESQFISQESIDVLTPTARNKPNKGLPKAPDEVEEEEFSGVSMVFVANPESSEDPFSQRFIVPFQAELDRDGYYEDDLHLIIVMNYHDNPWFEESGLEVERQWALKNLPRELYDHIWLGDFNDSVENSLITGEWFDSCVDAHEKLGWNVAGAKVAAHDPSDVGDDSKGYCMRHGSVVKRVEEKVEGDVNEGGHWACDQAISDNVDYFTFDADGMGVALNEQISKDLHEKPIRIAMFKGSESPDSPKSIYQPAQSATIENQKLVGDIFRNKRAQYYCELRDRIYRTYRWVVHGEFQDQDKCISFDSKTISNMKKLRAELCRMPVKPNGNGFIELYTKEIMRSKFGFRSPNLGDSVMMSMRYINPQVIKPKIPAPIGTMPLRRR